MTPKTKSHPLSYVVVSWLPAIVWMIVIFALSSRHSVSVSEEYWLNFLFFKMLHVLVYAGLMLTVSFALLRTSHSSWHESLLWAVIICLLYATSDEWHQNFVPTRQGTTRDIAIDAIGIFGVYFLLRWRIGSDKKLS